MLTLFTTAKPFRGHSGIIQRNALKSWTLLHPDAEVILFGDDDGAADTARDLGIRHEPHLERNSHGTKRLDYMFHRAQEIAKSELLCYVNCDILLMQDFPQALKRLKTIQSRFLAVGRRWDTNISEVYDFSEPEWETRLRSRALLHNGQRTPEWIDYFAFTRGLYGADMPPLVIGRVHWDNWLLWKARESKYPVVDLSGVVVAVHQNHDYGYHPQGKQGVWNDEESRQNYQLAGGWRHLRTIADASDILDLEGLRPNRGIYWQAVKRYVRQARRVLLFKVIHPIWFFALECTRPIRSVLGLRKEALRRSHEKRQEP
ncbi:MAG TPA: hypothetical protein VGI16_10840 [Candidatus Acidoferrum sp.]